MEDYKDYILRMVKMQTGDNLERAKAAFRNLSDDDLDRQYGQSGQTCRQILAEYQTARDYHVKAIAWLEDKLK